MPVAESEHLRKLFIGGLTLSTTDEMLKEFYAQWGDVVDHIVMKDPSTKRSRGFGFITYGDAESLEEAMRNRPHVIDGRQVDPKRAVPREGTSGPAPGTRISNNRLFISGVKDEHNEEVLTDYFQQFGPVSKVEIILDKNTGERRGFAFVTFDDNDAVEKCAVEESHMVNGKRLNVKRGEIRDASTRNAQQDRDRMGRAQFRGAYGGGRGGGRDSSWGGAGGYGGAQTGGWGQGGGGSWGQWGAQPAASSGYAGYGGYSGYPGYSQPAAAQPYGQAQSYGQTYGTYGQPQAATQWGAQQATPQATTGWQQPAATGAYPGYGTGYGTQGGYGTGYGTQ